MIRFLIVAVAMSSVLSGCLVRLRTVEKPRTDLEVKGNAGCLQGECKDVTKASKLSEKRLISVLEFELGKTKKELAKEQEDIGRRQEQVETYKSNLGRSVNVDEIKVEEEEDIVFEPSVLENQSSGPSGEIAITQTYVVQKGDTLQKISQKFYGTTKKYLYLYENNRDVLKSKDSLRVGQKLVIPAK